MIKIGDVIITPAMLLRVTSIGGNWIKCDYYDAKENAWLPRGRTENRKAVERKLATGFYELIEK